MAFLSGRWRTLPKRSSSLRAAGRILLILLLAGAPPGHAAPFREYQIKAVFLFNFALFVEWPPQAFPNPQAPLVIGVLGDDPFGQYLDETVRGESVNNRPLRVQRYRRLEDIKTCHVLFISASESARLESVLAGLKGRSILTVGDAEGFSARGVMVRFVTEQNRIRFKINLDAAKDARLTLSSKLLRPAEIVSSRED